MKNLFFLLFGYIILTALISCSANMDNSDPFDDFLKEWNLTLNNDCSEETNAAIYPPSTKEIEETDETIHSMSTCGLLRTLLDYPPNTTGPWNYLSSNLFLSGVTNFNKNFNANKVAIELFNRKDFFSVLTSKYLSNMEESVRYGIGRFSYLEMALASDLCMKKLNEFEKRQLMAITLKRSTLIEADYLNETCHIMIAIMKSDNYTPFIEDIGSRLNESTRGYTLSKSRTSLIEEDTIPNDDESTIPDIEGLIWVGLSPQTVKSIIKYANMFLNDLK